MTAQAFYMATQSIYIATQSFAYQPVLIYYLLPVVTTIYNIRRIVYMCNQKYVLVQLFIRSQLYRLNINLHLR